MRYSIAICLTFLLSLPVFAQVPQAQADPHETLHAAVVLERQGGYEEAIQIARHVIESKQLTGVALGRAYIVLGAAYKHKGDFPAGQQAFEQSLHILAHDDAHAGDYASALENYAGLYSDDGQVAVAISMWKKALRLRLRIGEHAGAMLSLVDLAGAALAQHRRNVASKYLSQAVEEGKLASARTDGDLTDDDILVLLETQGWLALAEGNSSAAKTDYERALEICVRIHGERHWLTGWEHMLLGKAYAQGGDLNRALWDAREGLEIIKEGAGTKSPEYFAGEIAYSQALDRTGAHLQAAQLKADAEQLRKDLYGGKCARCTITAEGLR